MVSNDDKLNRKFIKVKGKKVPIKIEYIQLGEKENEKRIDTLARLIIQIMEDTKRRDIARTVRSKNES